jgi:hypothetical protein
MGWAHPGGSRSRRRGGSLLHASRSDDPIPRGIREEEAIGVFSGKSSGSWTPPGRSFGMAPEGFDEPKSLP